MMEIRQEIYQWRASEAQPAASQDSRSSDYSPWLALGDDLNRLFEAFFQSLETGLLSPFSDPFMFQQQKAHEKESALEKDS